LDIWECGYGTPKHSIALDSTARLQLNVGRPADWWTTPTIAKRSLKQARLKEELLIPDRVDFYDQKWEEIGTKEAWTAWFNQCNSI
jgi:hypothetical protein